NQDFLDTPGIAYFNKSNIFVKNPKENPINLNDFPPFSVKHNLIRPIEITRGCAWKCRFCQIRSRGGSIVRHRSISQILKYIEITIKHYSNRRPDIRFISPNALSNGSSHRKDLELNYLEELI
ncbi:MAG: B12-binding domain-containing radical SAM protein, partial [Candidatus Heimdallarchaeota archaeon]